MPHSINHVFTRQAVLTQYRDEDRIRSFGVSTPPPQGMKMGTTKLTVKERFLKDVNKHTMTILKDDEMYRHLRFSNDGSSFYRFDLITWPGYLAYVGDMGDYVFKRVEDMFRFFRRHPDDKELKINLGYWSEKVQAYCRDGIREYSDEKFSECINEMLKDYLESADLTDDDTAELKERVLEEVDCNPGNEQDARDAAVNFEFNDESIFDSDFYEHDLTDYTYRFEWCCWAMVWGIQVYDAEKARLAEVFDKQKRNLDAWVDGRTLNDSQRTELVKAIKDHWVGSPEGAVEIVEGSPSEPDPSSFVAPEGLGVVDSFLVRKLGMADAINLMTDEGKEFIAKIVAESKGSESPC